MEIEALLAIMVKTAASDLFITANLPPRMMVNGRIRELKQPPLSEAQVHELVTGLMTPEQQDEFKTTMECNFAVGSRELGRFRVSAYVQRNTSGMVIRRIESRIPTFEELHLPSVIAELSMAQRGLVILVGATGSGKSTTLAAMVGHRNRNFDGHIICIEDPVEFTHTHERCIVTQREVGIDTVSYLVGLKNALRQAPDTMLIGEVRQMETMDHAMHFAETGHLCFTTLHANDTTQALERILNFFPREQRQVYLADLATNLRAIIGQQLVPTADGNGRRVAVEVLLNTGLVADLIRKGEFHKIRDVIRRSTELGMQTFDQSIFDLYRVGVIGEEEALRHATSENEVRLMIKLHNTEDPNRMGDGMENVTLVE